MVGPVLIKQDLVEARANVDNRLGYITKELSRLDSTLKNLNGKRQEKEKDLQRLTQRLQQMQQEAAKQAAKQAQAAQ
jgi:prefoldin beta subunit